MKALLLSVLILVVHSASIADAKDVALTFDDCPRRAGPVLQPMERDQKLVAALKAEGLVAAFFCNSPSREPNGLERLKFFADSGHLIANHTAQHPDLDKTPVDDYIKGIDQADQELRSLPNFRKWFRFPYLHEGKNVQDIEAVRAHLKKTGYVNGYVTIDDEDWYVDDILKQKVKAGKSYDEKKLCQTYADVLLDDAKFYDELALKALGRAPKQVLLLHETDLNAICLPVVIREFKKQKWNFVSPDMAYADPIAAQEPKSSTKLNNGRVYALALEAKVEFPNTKRWNGTKDLDKEFDRRGIWK